jgi:mono/diheme cytochrome c family protein
MSSNRRRQPASIGRTPASSGRLLQRVLIAGFVIFAVIMLAIFMVRSANPSEMPQLGRADQANAAQVAAGRTRYATRCASCHGTNLEGGSAVALGASGTTWQRDDAWVFTTIKAGGQATAPAGAASAMPAFGGSLSDDEIWAIVAYIKSNWPQKR